MPGEGQADGEGDLSPEQLEVRCGMPNASRRLGADRVRACLRSPSLPARRTRTSLYKR